MVTFRPAYQYRGKVTRVIDGDTIVVQVDLGFKTWVEKTLRLARINAPELPTPAGVLSRDYVNKYLLIDNTGEIFFDSKKLDSYGRSIAEIKAITTGIEESFLSDIVVSGGHADYKKY